MARRLWLLRLAAMVVPRKGRIVGTRDYVPPVPLFEGGETAAVAPAVRRCRACGAYLARDNASDDGLCSPCSRSRLRADEPEKDYNPRHDPYFVEKVARVLFEHFGQRALISEFLEADSWQIGEAVKVLRSRWGFVIEADKRVAGYRLVGWQPPLVRHRGRPRGSRKKVERA